MTNILFVIIAIFALILIIFFINSIKIKKFANQNDEANLQSDTKKRSNESDILKILKFKSQIWFNDGVAFDNFVQIIYSAKFPRNFSNNLDEILEIISLCVRFYISKLHKALISVEFKEQNRVGKNISFVIKISANKNFSNSQNIKIMKFLENSANFDDLNLLEARNLTLKTNNILVYEFTDSSSSINLNVNLNFQKENFPLFLSKKYDQNALIACDNSDIFANLSGVLKEAGLEVKPENSWANIIKHIDNFIYTPDIVFIDAEILKDKNNITYLNNIRKNSVFFVIIIKNRYHARGLEELSFNYFKLKMPYIYDDIYAILELSKKLKSSKISL